MPSIPIPRSPALDRSETIREIRELRINLAILLLILVALCLVGRDTKFWPVMTWPMYSTLTTNFPPPEASIVQLRVVTRDGDRIVVTPRELFPKGQDKLSKWVIEHAFNAEDATRAQANREWLSLVVRDRFPQTELKAVEGWKLIWQVDPLAVPPLVHDQPAKQILLGSFIPEGNSSGVTR